MGICRFSGYQSSCKIYFWDICFHRELATHIIASHITRFNPIHIDEFGIISLRQYVCQFGRGLDEHPHPKRLLGIIGVIVRLQIKTQLDLVSTKVHWNCCHNPQFHNRSIPLQLETNQILNPGKYVGHSTCDCNPRKWSSRNRY